MSKPDAVATILWLGATLYAVFAGADFGGGVLAALSLRDRKLGPAVRKRIGNSIGPVWEANHVWLIFCLVVLWTAFPAAFGPLMETLYVPLTLAALGIVLRGSGFAFGHALEEVGAARAERVFAFASVLTPFFMGCVVGAVATGNVPADGSGDPFSSWLEPLPILVGLLFVASSTYLAAIFLRDDSRRAGQRELFDYFDHRALQVAVVAGVLAAAGLIALRADARFVFDGLVGPALPLVIASVLLGGLVVAGLLRKVERGLRPLAVGAVVAVVWGWGVAQHPFLLPQSLTIDGAAGATDTLTATIIVFVAALAIVGPSLALLYSLSQKQVLED